MRRIRSRFTRSKKVRNRQGRVSNLPILIAFIMLVAAGSLLFMSSNRTDRSPVQEAALEAARQMSDIIVNSPECGFVGLSYSAPAGKGTESADKFGVTVRGINDIIGTVRLDLIIADKLGQPLMEEFAESDYKAAMAAKDLLIESLRKSIAPGGSADGIDGQPISVYDSAARSFESSGGSKKQELRLSLGCIEGGSATVVRVPEPQLIYAVDAAAKEGNFYKSYVNLPCKELAFVFGGIGSAPALVDQRKWREKIDSLPYQIPTVIRVEVVKKGGSSEIACAQPGARPQPSAFSGALTISFPDGPVPEIKKPEDCYLNEKLNSLENDWMDLLTASGGDYPVDIGTVMKSMNWPLTGSASSEPAANIWRLALYDWIRKAGPLANVDSVVSMQKVLLDPPKPAKIMWKAPMRPGDAPSQIAPISAGIIHIFEFDGDGFVVYKSKLMAPYPLDAISENQMFGESFGAIDYSDIGIQEVIVPFTPTPRKITLIAAWDVFIRDHVRHLGTISGGKHAGEPIAKPILAYRPDYPARGSTPCLEGLVIEAVVDQEEQSSGFTDETAGQTMHQTTVPSSMPATDHMSFQSADQDYGKGRRKRYGKGRVGVTGENDTGCPPLIAPQTDFNETMIPQPPVVRPMPFGSGPRPLYEISASAVDIRFRRQVDVMNLVGRPTTGYFGITGSDE